MDRFSKILGLKNHAVTRIRTWVASATTKSTNHYTITAIGPLLRREVKIYINNRFFPVYFHLGTIHKGRLLKGVGRWVHQKEIY